LPPPRRFHPALAEEIERVILKALAKNRDDRFATAHDLVRALQLATETGPLALLAQPQYAGRQLIELPTLDQELLSHQ
jgi:hypothetical protein